MALRAPVLAALFLIVALATLAMPGSANFIGEFYILNGLFQAKIVFAFVAISGVAMSAYYALRLYQHDDAQPQARRAASREIGLRDGLVLAPLVLCILGLALYPQLILHRTAPTVQQTVASVTGEAGAPGRAPKRAAGGQNHVMASDELQRAAIDYAGISPIIALTVGLCVVLLAAVFKPVQRLGAGADAADPGGRPPAC